MKDDHWTEKLVSFGFGLFMIAGALFFAAIAFMAIRHG